MGNSLPSKCRADTAILPRAGSGLDRPGFVVAAQALAFLGRLEHLDLRRAGRPSELSPQASILNSPFRRQI